MQEESGDDTCFASSNLTWVNFDPNSDGPRSRLRGAAGGDRARVSPTWAVALPT